MIIFFLVGAYYAYLIWGSFKACIIGGCIFSLVMTTIIAIVASLAQKQYLKRRGLKLVTKTRVIHHKYDDGFGAYYVDETRTEDFYVPIDSDEKKYK